MNVDEHRRAPGVVNRPGRREERERSRDDFVPWLEVQRFKREEQRVRSARASDPMPGMRKLCHFSFQLRNPGAHDELLRLDDLHHRGEHIALDGVVLRDQIEHGDVHEAPTRAGVIWRNPPPVSV